MTDTDRSIIAAQGYMELGLFNEARRELQNLPRQYFEHPEVIELGLMCFLGEQRWSEALAMAYELCAAAPGEPGGYIHAAYCLHEMDRTAEALEVLKNGPKSLRTKSVFYYNLGCYNARLGQVADALRCLERSFELDAGLRRVARKDPDLAALRPHLI